MLIWYGTCMLIRYGKVSEDTEETRMKLGRKKSITVTSPREGVTACHAGPTWDVPGFGQVAEEGSKRKSLGQSLYFGFRGKSKARQRQHLGTG